MPGTGAKPAKKGSKPSTKGERPPTGFAQSGVRTRSQARAAGAAPAVAVAQAPRVSTADPDAQSVSSSASGHSRGGSPRLAPAGRRGSGPRGPRSPRVEPGTVASLAKRFTAERAAARADNAWVRPPRLAPDVSPDVSAPAPVPLAHDHELHPREFLRNPSLSIPSAAPASRPSAAVSNSHDPSRSGRRRAHTSPSAHSRSPSGERKFNSGRTQAERAADEESRAAEVAVGSGSASTSVASGAVSGDDWDSMVAFMSGLSGRQRDALRGALFDGPPRDSAELFAGTLPVWDGQGDEASYRLAMELQRENDAAALAAVAQVESDSQFACSLSDGSEFSGQEAAAFASPSRRSPARSKRPKPTKSAGAETVALKCAPAPTGGVRPRGRVVGARYGRLVRSRVP